MNLEKLESIGCRLLEFFPHAQGVWIYAFEQDNKPPALIWSTDGLHHRGYDRERLLGNARRERKVTLIDDARADALTNNVESKTFHSAICAPIKSQKGGAVGAVLITSQKVGAFNIHGRFAVEGQSREIAEALRPQEPAPNHQTDQGFTISPPPENLLDSATLGRLLFPTLLIVGLFFLFVLLVLYSAPGDKDDVSSQESCPVVVGVVTEMDVSQGFSKTLMLT